MQRELWEKCVEFHGHSCPGLAYGFQAVRLFAEHWGLKRARDEELVCITENDACGVDAIQFLLGCTFGKGNLIYRPRGKHAYSFFQEQEKEGLRLVLKRRELEGEREEKIKAILNEDPRELFLLKRPNFSCPGRALIFNTIECENCGEGTAEPFIRLQEEKKLCLDCLAN